MKGILINSIRLPEELDRRVKILSSRHEYIRQQYAEGMTQVQLAMQYDCCTRTIFNIIHHDSREAQLERGRIYQRNRHAAHTLAKKSYSKSLYARKKVLVQNMDPATIANSKLQFIYLPTEYDRRKKLTEAQRTEIIEKYKSSRTTYRALAEEYGCSPSTIATIVNPAAKLKQQECSRRYAKTHPKYKDKETANAYQRELRRRKRYVRDKAIAEEAEKHGTYEEL